MHLRHGAAALCGAMVIALAAAACGGGDDDRRSGLPDLEGTPLPTVTPTTCDVAEPLPLPANFPSDVAAPPNYLIESVDTAPFLRTVGRTNPPADEAGIRSPMQMLEFAIQDNMKAGWTFGPNESDSGLDYTFTHADGRSGRYVATLVDGCPPYHLALTYEIPWVLP